MLLPLVVGAMTGPGIWVERTAYLMGTEAQVQVEAADRDAALQASQAVLAEFARMEGLLSTWDSTSVMGRLNRSPVGQAMAADREVAALVSQALAWSRATAGAFDPAVGPLVDAWDLRGAGRIPGEEELAAALAAVRAGLRVDPSSSTLTRAHPDAWLDTGGFGKGAALASAARVLAGEGVANASLNLGGQLLLLGAPADAHAWTVPVAHPRHREDAVASLRVRDASVATSGASERFIEVDGARFGHLLDPRTGRPVPAWGSVTVVAADPLVADILSTALFVLGPEEGLRWARHRDDIGVLFLEDTPGGLAASWNPAMDAWLHTPPARRDGARLESTNNLEMGPTHDG